jgi:hypothetical protein
MFVQVLDLQSEFADQKKSTENRIQQWCGSWRIGTGLPTFLSTAAVDYLGGLCHRARRAAPEGSGQGP